MYCRTEYGGFGSVAGKIEIEVKINHEGVVNRSVIHLHHYLDSSLSVERAICLRTRSLLLQRQHQLNEFLFDYSIARITTRVSQYSCELLTRVPEVVW